MEARLEPKLAMWVHRTTYFHPWVDKVAQVVPNGAQSGSKGAQRLPKWSQHGSKIRPKAFRGRSGSVPENETNIDTTIYAKKGVKLDVKGGPNWSQKKC